MTLHRHAVDRVLDSETHTGRNSSAFTVTWKGQRTEDSVSLLAETKDFHDPHVVYMGTKAQLMGMGVYFTDGVAGSK